MDYEMLFLLVLLGRVASPEQLEEVARQMGTDVEELEDELVYYERLLDESGRW